MWSYTQSARRKRCRDLKYKGYTIKEIMAVTGFSRSTVGRYVEGIKDQREKQAPISQKKPISQSEGKGKQGGVGKLEKYGKSRPEQHISQIPQKETANVGNTDQNSVSHNSQRRDMTNVGVKIIVCLGIVILILILLDHFVFDGKIFAWFSEELESQNQALRGGEKIGCGSCGKGFMGRDVSEFEEF